jgi:hypothetical protein
MNALSSAIIMFIPFPTMSMVFLTGERCMLCPCSGLGEGHYT